MLAPDNIAFSGALALMLALGLVRALGFADGMDLDVDSDLPDALAWLGVGRVPIMILIVLFLALFGLIGLIGQQLVAAALGQPLSGWIAVPVAATASLAMLRGSAGLLGRVLPGDLTTAIDTDDLIGGTATIVVGTARQGSPARARAEDRFGQEHYLMVEPDNPGVHFEQGEHVLIVRREGQVFRAISRGDHRLPHLGG
ncbi:YqiJ family protein [Sphingomonas sp. BGYR3]|uniref:YqiJ family protein n=1 Tax=Sphingomonas sp. BGYR3 TaxID=2975483 RepID=UPI0021A8EF4E|nr:YqiJ family protein [Sphingomonas sp. BGYR3]MDG5488019.1 YqiJ family protein [Sphingomonas sp. BGYR3]